MISRPVSTGYARHGYYGRHLAIRFESGGVRLMHHGPHGQVIAAYIKRSRERTATRNSYGGITLLRHERISVGRRRQFHPSRHDYLVSLN